MIQNLTSENFWDELHDAFPEAVVHFWQWFSEYKKEVGWVTLFADSATGVAVVNFADIPFEMQYGILHRYELELLHNSGGRGKDSYVVIAEQLKGQSRSLFAELEKRIALFKTGSRG